MNSREFPNKRTRARQRGAAAVEFGIIAMVFFTLFFGIVEFGRFFYLYNTVQEITRCAAREAVVSCEAEWDKIKNRCIFQAENAADGALLPAGGEISNLNVKIFLRNAGGGMVDPPGTPDENIAYCSPVGGNPNLCIRDVQASVYESSTKCDNKGEDCKVIAYQPMFGLIPLTVGIPGSTVLMPAESLGYRKAACYY